MLQREHPFFCRKASVCYNLLRGFPPSSTVEQIHAQVVIHGLSDNAFLATHLLKSYAKAGRVCDARLLFNSHSKPDIFLCNAIIRAHTHFELWPQALQLYLQMRRKGVLPDHFTLPFVLKSCAALSAINNGKKLQRTDWKFELADIIEEDKLQQSNLRLGLSATKEGQKIHQWSVISDGEKLKQTPLQLGLSDISEGEKLHKTALQLRLSAISDGEKPSQSNPQTGLCATREGKKLHKTALELGLESNVYIATALLDFYAKSGDMDAAYKVFDEMPQKDVVTWSAMIAGYSELGDSNKALRMFQKMRSAPDCEYNEVTILGLIPAFKGSVKLCKWVHGLVLKSGLGSFHLVVTTLIDAYAKCGDLLSSRELFNQVPLKNIITWGSMINGYSENGHAFEALDLFYTMLGSSGLDPDHVMVACVLQASAHLGSVHHGSRVHAYATKYGLVSHSLLGSALIDMYAKCGCLESSLLAFKEVSKRNVISCTAMISAYGMHGYGKEAIKLFKEMELEGIEPDGVVFLNVISACSHSGLIEEGLHCFQKMVDVYGIMPCPKHYACMVDLLGRAGLTNEAVVIIERMPHAPDASMWGALLSACRNCGAIGVAEMAFRKLVELDSCDREYYVLLANAYAASGRWRDVSRVRKSMRERVVRSKTPGCSYIEVNCRVHVFYVGNTSHPESENIYCMLESIFGQAKFKENGFEL